MARNVREQDAIQAAALLGLKPPDLAFALRVGAITKLRVEANLVMRGARPNSRVANALITAAEALEGPS